MMMAHGAAIHSVKVCQLDQTRLTSNYAAWSNLKSCFLAMKFSDLGHMRRGLSLIYRVWRALCGINEGRLLFEVAAFFKYSKEKPCSQMTSYVILSLLSGSSVLGFGVRNCN